MKETMLSSLYNAIVNNFLGLLPKHLCRRGFYRSGFYVLQLPNFGEPHHHTYEISIGKKNEGDSSRVILSWLCRQRIDPIDGLT